MDIAYPNANVPPPSVGFGTLRGLGDEAERYSFCFLRFVSLIGEDALLKDSQLTDFASQAEYVEQFDGPFDNVGDSFGRARLAERGKELAPYFAREPADRIPEAQELRFVMHPAVECQRKLLALRMHDPQNESAERAKREMDDDTLLRWRGASELSAHAGLLS
jgi:hypothetical protein